MTKKERRRKRQILRGRVDVVIGDVVARVYRRGCDRRGIGVRHGTGQPQTDNVHALSRSSLLVVRVLRLLG